ncbi:MAG TPA: hypothetical protein VH438_10875 [Gemmatimonadales bacterium]|jgi:hypothetical protein
MRPGARIRTREASIQEPSALLSTGFAGVLGTLRVAAVKVGLGELLGLAGSSAPAQALARAALAGLLGVGGGDPARGPVHDVTQRAVLRKGAKAGILVERRRLWR